MSSSLIHGAYLVSGKYSCLHSYTLAIIFFLERFHFSNKLSICDRKISTKLVLFIRDLYFCLVGWCCLGDVREKRYFFYNYKGNANEKMRKRVADSGSWKPVGKEKQIAASEGQSNQAFGTRTTLLFHEKKRPRHEKKTRWVMHEYRLVGSETTPDPTQVLITHRMKRSLFVS